VAAYNQVAALDLQATGAAAYYRQVKPREWPPGFRVHYEFYRTSKGIGAELHLESDAAKPLAAILQPLAGVSLTPESPPLTWDQAWNSGRGRLTSRFSPGANPSAVAQAMVELIKRTCAIVQTRLLELAAT
jgi:hypothetical protein